MVECVTQIKSGVRTNVDVRGSATFTYENGKYLESIIGDSVIMFGEIIEATKNRFKENFSNKKAYKNNCSDTFLYFTHLFINYHSIIDSCWYLLLPNKIFVKTKTFIAILRHQ